MSTRPPNDSLGPLDHLALRYLRRALDMSHPTDEPYVLNPVESQVIRRTKIITLSMVTLLSIVGIALFYWPQYNWPDLFRPTTIQAFGQVFSVYLVTILYSLLLVYLEVNILLVLNMWGVKMIMDVCHFPREHDPQYERHLLSLADASLKNTRHRILPIGVDPYLNMPRWGLTTFFLLSTGKAALTTWALKSVSVRLIGQSFLHQIVDLAAMPIYAAWNMLASWQVLHETQIRVMAPTTIREFVHELHEEWGNNDQFKGLIVGALQYILILKHQHNYAHFLFTEILLDRFKVNTDQTTVSGFLDDALQAPLAVRRSLERLIVFGALIDGKLSWSEKRLLRKLRKKGFLTYSTDEIRRMSVDYNQGRGLWV